MTFDELIARWTKKSSGFRSSEFGIGKKEGIEELLVELRDLKQDARIAELTADLNVADRALLDLAAEVARYRASLEKIGYFSAVSDNHSDSMATIARNALKDGV